VIFDVVTPDEYGMRNTIRNSITITGKIDIDEKTVSLYQWALLPATNSDCYKKITVEYYQKNVLVREVQFSKAFVVDYTEQYSNHTGVGTFSIYLRQFYKQDIDVTTEETKTVNSEAMVADESEKIEAVQQAENSPVERVVESTNKASMSFTDRVEKQKEMGDNSNEGVGDFTGTLKEQNVTLKNVKTQTIQYTKRSGQELADLRKAFNSNERKNFLKNIANDPVKANQLKKAGLSDADIQMMQDGLVPSGYQVHHKIPLDGGGTNAMDNLVMIKNDPYHKVITNTQNSLTKGLSAGDSVEITNWPIPDGFVYPNK
jgi:hypothetical protein